MTENPKARKRVRKTEFTIPEAARFLRISTATMYNWVNCGGVDEIEIPWHWKKAKNGREIKVITWSTLCELREAYPSRIKEETADRYIETRRLNGKLKTGGKPGFYKPKNRDGYVEREARKLSRAEAAYYDKKCLLKSEEERDQI
ncbi:hypothetical protein [Kocuria sp. HSID16901]|uniref:hypothetical protein n=1 Tax=Kocuria sp. HSID16901 TaxID=2419505 RepID=UPI000F8722BB|nr:hypothetical protein [Kocuria sp. HSID16901]